MKRGVVEQVPQGFLQLTARNMRAGGATLKNEFLVVKIFHANAMADADHRRAGEIFIEQAQHRNLTLFIERRRRFIHDDDLRPLQQEPNKSRSLPLAAGKRLVPALLFVEMLDEITQAASPHRAFDHIVGDFLVGN